MSSIVIAQGPLYDRVDVNLPYAVNVNGTVLPAGHYEIRQFQSAAGGSRIVHFFSDGGMKFETTAMGIAALDNRTPEETKVILEHLGSDYYLNKIWVQGKNYGYEFPLPENIRNREKERNTETVAARYQAPSDASSSASSNSASSNSSTSASSSTTTTTTTTTERTEVAQAAPAPVEQAQTAPEPAPAPVEQAQTTPAPAPEAAPVAAAPAPEPAPMPAPAMSADRMTAADRTMPATAGNWLSLLLTGGLLTSSGFALRRFRS